MPLIENSGLMDLTLIIVKRLSYSLACSSSHSRNKCVSLYALTPYVLVCDQTMIVHLQNICSRSYICMACLSDDIENVTAS